MNKFLATAMALAALVLPVLAAENYESSTIKNSTNGTVFAIRYGSGAATVVVDGVISASAINYASTNSTYASVTAGILTITTNAVMTGPVAFAGGATNSGVLLQSGDAIAQDTQIGSLSVTTNAWVTGTLIVTGATTIVGDSLVQDLTVGGLTVTTNTTHTGTTTLTGDTVGQDVTAGTLAVSTNATVTGTLGVTGDATFSDVSAGRLTWRTNSITMSGVLTDPGTNAIVADSIGFTIVTTAGTYTIRAYPN